MDTIGSKLKALIEKKGITPYELSENTGVSQSTLSRIINKNSKPNIKNRKILAEYFNVSNNYFLLENEEDTLSDEEDYLENKNGNKFQDLGNGKFIMTVPLVPAKAYATYISECCEGDFIDGFNEVNFYVDQYARGNYVAFEIKGDSMDNGGLYDNPEGCITLCRELNRQHWKDGFRDSQYGWIIVHKDTIICKDIISQNLENGIITCHSRNTSPEFQDFTIELNDVKQIFKIVKRTF
ncbi:helix-turn-helix transcriptional regulator [Flavobacterium sp. GT3P67]|uniref:LexA family transcriptional regulator n=1 Tax=Flavobacterium sp. GT3P67 TaxID=2541722 RepID=UPI00104D7A39|nr:helix-turn-helix transcriptional regulator [Flavobacterium sp. GT3P67]TDE53796.1 XRE family transcriptional regulator [Flavobacterium sp. GT3P67]